MPLARLIHLAECAFLIALAWLIVGRMLPILSEHPQVVLFLIAELLGVLLIVLQRPGAVATGSRPVLLGFAGTGASLLVIPVGQQLAINAVSSAFIFGGLSLSILAKLSLRRSFGLVAANRGVKKNGVYRFVRHPMYSGYILNQTGFLLTFASAWNIAVVTLAWILLWMRTQEEEKVLLADPDYRTYAKSVKSRLVPGLL